jgi:signal transduction histidine kinase
MNIIFEDTKEITLEEKFIRSKKLASIGRLSAYLVHELNNPIDGVIRYAKLLLNQMEEDDPKIKYVEQMLDGLVRIRGMVRGMFEFTWKNGILSCPVDIPSSIKRILSTFSDQITAQKINVETEFDGNIPFIMNPDVENIFANIIKNAIQAMPEGGTLTLKAKMITPNMFEARFTDTGTGIPDEIYDMIFEPFFTTKSTCEGIGLGLSISNEIAKSYNGSIEVEREKGKSTTFIVKLPINEGGLTEISDLR